VIKPCKHVKRLCIALQRKEDMNGATGTVSVTRNAANIIKYQ